MTEVTSNLRVTARANRRTGTTEHVGLAPRARSYDPRRCDSDSEGNDERACFRRGSLPRLTDERRVAWREPELDPRDRHRVLCWRRGQSTAYVLSDHGGPGRWDVRAAAVLGDARGARLVRVPARRSRGSLRMAPDRAQQRGVLPRHQRQHD